MPLNDDVFTALAHPVRRDILVRLADGDLNTTELAAPYDVTRSAVSQHLGLLVEAGLVSRTRHGREQRYQIQPENLNQVAVWVRQFEQFWNTRLDALADVLDEMEAEDDAT